MHQSGGKIRPVLRSLSPNFSIIYPFQILMGRFQNILNKAMSKSWMLRLPNLLNSSPTGCQTTHYL